MWHVTCDMWHVTHDMLGGVNILSNIQLPSSYCLGFMIFKGFGENGSLTEWMNESISNSPGYTGSVSN